ncbi:MAG: hypothetical protein ACLR1T_01880 [Evtepia gabavorous]
MAGNPAHKAAIALAERRIFCGGNRWGRPGSSGRRPVTRGVCWPVAMDVVELETLPEAATTGFRPTRR